jgi:plasmid maintenance system antidote protein VapI
MTKKLADIGNQELADFLGISRQHASNIRTGKENLPPKYCLRVSVHFAIDLHTLRPDIYPKTPKTVVKKTGQQSA